MKILMNWRWLPCFLCVLLCVNGLRADVIDELLADFPPKDPAGQTELKNKLHDLNTEQVLLLCSRLQPDGNADGKIRSLLQAVCMEADTHEGLGKATQAAFGRVLSPLQGQAFHPHVRRLLLEQWQLFLDGSPATLNTIAPLLDQTETCSAAARCLAAMDTPAASEALARALSGASTWEARAILTGALIRCSHPAGSEQMSALLGEADCPPELHWLLLEGLVSSSSPTIILKLSGLMRSGNRTDKARAGQLMLRLARTLHGNGEVPKALSILRGLGRNKAPQWTHMRCASLSLLCELEGAMSLPEVLAAITDESDELRSTARRLAVRIDGPNTDSLLTAALAEASDESSQLAVLQVLADRKTKGSVKAIKPLLKSDSLKLMTAAVETLVTVDALQAGDIIASEIFGGPSTARAGLARKALANSDHPGLDLALAQRLPKATAPEAAQLLRVLVARKATTTVPVWLPVLQSEDAAVQTAALSALASLGDDSHLDAVSQLLGSKNPQASTAAGAALRGIVRRSDDKPLCARLIIRQLGDQQSSRDQMLFTALSYTGQAEAFEILAKAAASEDVQQKAVGYRALQTWSNPEQADQLLELARAAEDQRQHILTLRSYVQLVATADAWTVQQKSTGLQAALPVCRRIQEKRRVLSAMGGLGDAHVAPLLQRLVETDAELRPEALAAQLVLAESLLESDWQTSRQLAAQLLAAKDGPHKQAQRILAATEKFQAVTSWLVSGPYSRNGVSGNDLLPVRFPPELGAAAWKVQPINRGERYWFIDLNASIGSANAAGYLYTTLVSPDSRTAVLSLGSDDGLKVWLNGAQVHNNPAYRGCSQHQDAVEVQLKAGVNHLLLKVTNGGGGWAATLTVRNKEGQTMRDIIARCPEPGRFSVDAGLKN